MPRIRLDKDLRPVTEFRANAAALINQVRETKRPVVLTQRGRGAVVLVDVEEYQRMIEALETARKGTPSPPVSGSTFSGVLGPSRAPTSSGVDALVDADADALVDAFKDGIDRSLIMENLSRPVDERLRRLAALAEFSESLRRAPRGRATPSAGGGESAAGPESPTGPAAP